MCPWLKVLDEKQRVAECEILMQLGVAKIPGPARAGFPCASCKNEWKDGEPPTISTVTPTIQGLADAVAGKDIVTKVINYVKSTVKWILKDGPECSDEEFGQRKSVCVTNICGYLTADNECRKCGCPIEDKARRATEDCPMDLWVKNEYTKTAPKRGCCGR